MRAWLASLLLLSLACAAAGQEAPAILLQPSEVAPMGAPAEAPDADQAGPGDPSTAQPPMPTYATPAAYVGNVLPDSKYAPYSLDPDLRRLGPQRGACEVGWYKGRVWFMAEYLAWDTKGAYLPALVTTGDPATPQADAGALDQPDTEVLAGDANVHGDWRSGGRFTLGIWHSPAQRLGIEANYWGLDGRDIFFLADSADYQGVLARPYDDAVGGDPDSELIAYPGLMEGTTTVDADFELIGAEALVRHPILWRERGRIDVLAGYRHAYLYDRLIVHDESSLLTPIGALQPGDLIGREDLFRTKNYFHGGELGVSTRLWRGCWSLELVGKFALGGVFTRTTIDGRTVTVEDPTGTPLVTEYEGGVLAQATNGGFRKFEDTAFLSELGIKLEYQIRTDTRLGLGYTFFYWDTVSRVESLVNTSVNPSQIPPGALMGVAAPEFTHARTDFWAHGLNATLEYQF